MASNIIYESGEDRKSAWKEAAAGYNEEGTGEIVPFNKNYIMSPESLYVMFNMITSYSNATCIC